jgi:hypothetical protein
MRKLAVGCGAIVVLLAIGGAIGAWWLTNRVRSAVAEFSELAKVPDIEREVRNNDPFAPPDDRELTPEQVDRYIRVQQSVRDHLGARFTELNEKYRDLRDRQQRGEDSVIDAPQIIAAYRDLATTYVEAKRSQVDALNRERFSLSEYRWVRRQTYAALGVPVLDLDVSGFIDDVKSGRTPRRPDAEYVQEPAGPERNGELVEPHRELLTDNAALTFFGL